MLQVYYTWDISRPPGTQIKCPIISAEWDRSNNHPDQEGVLPKGSTSPAAAPTPPTILGSGGDRHMATET